VTTPTILVLNFSNSEEHCPVDWLASICPYVVIASLSFIALFPRSCSLCSLSSSDPSLSLLGPCAPSTFPWRNLCPNVFVLAFCAPARGRCVITQYNLSDVYFNYIQSSEFID